MGTDHLGLGAAGRSYGAAAPELLHKLAFSSRPSSASPSGRKGVFWGRPLYHLVASQPLVPRVFIFCTSSAIWLSSHPLRHSAAGQIRGYSSERSFCTLGRWKSADWKSDSLLTSLLFFLYYPIRNLVRLVSSRSVPFGAFGPDYMYSP
ncbi:hypothetical protein DTO027B5_1731 [Paecilomyces variotii]|nr:hypothetical protein DTO027B3_1273 [Paecilomyces variotii]KAJ9336416.1 hypothetical protein DTO027B5_1731 [Paecilomyces variotii]